MNYEFYEKKINDVILKCPIEAGVEILVYNLLDSILESKKLSLIEINRLRKDRDERLTTDAGIPDMAIVSEDFRYRTEIGQVYGFVEIKATNTGLIETEQVEGQRTKALHYLYTNGLTWKYYKDRQLEWEVSLAYLNGNKCEKITDFQYVNINEKAFNNLINELKGISWI